MKVSHRYGKLETRTFTLTRDDVRQAVLAFVAKHSTSVIPPVGAEQEWVVEFNADGIDLDGEPLATARQTFIYGIQDAPRPCCCGTHGNPGRCIDCPTHGTPPPVDAVDPVNRVTTDRPRAYGGIHPAPGETR